MDLWIPAVYLVHHQHGKWHLHYGHGVHVNTFSPPFQRNEKPPREDKRRLEILWKWNQSRQGHTPRSSAFWRHSIFHALCSLPRCHGQTSQSQIIWHTQAENRANRHRVNLNDLNDPFTWLFGGGSQMKSCFYFGTPAHIGAVQAFSRWSTAASVVWWVVVVMLMVVVT